MQIDWLLSTCSRDIYSCNMFWAICHICRMVLVSPGHLHSIHRKNVFCWCTERNSQVNLNLTSNTLSPPMTVQDHWQLSERCSIYSWSWLHVLFLLNFNINYGLTGLLWSVKFSSCSERAPHVLCLWLLRHWLFQKEKGPFQQQIEYIKEKWVLIINQMYV